MSDNIEHRFLDSRIKHLLDHGSESQADGEFATPRGLAFDHHRGLLFVVDTCNHRVQVLSANDGSFVSKFGSQGDQPGEFQYPVDIELDHSHDRIVVTDGDNRRMQSWSLKDLSFVSCFDAGLSDIQLLEAEGVTIDNNHHRIIIADTHHHRLVVLSSIDLSFLFAIGGTKGQQPREFYGPSGAAIDHDRDRIIVADSNNRVQVLSSIDGSFLFKFGSRGNQPGQFDFPYGVCVINQGRIIVVDTFNNRLQAFTSEGHFISSFDSGSEYPWKGAFDSHRGLIAFTAGHQIHVIEANQWLVDTFVWRPDRHLYAPESIKQSVMTMTMIRSLIDESPLSLIPNEILFLIFEIL